MEIKKHLKSLCFWVKEYNLDPLSYDYGAILKIYGLFIKLYLK